MKTALPRTIGIAGMLALLCSNWATAAAPADQMPAQSIRGLQHIHVHGPAKAAGAARMSAGINAASYGGPVPGIDSLVNFTGSYKAAGVDSYGNPTSTWTYAMVGRSPRGERGATLRAPVIPVIVDLRDAAGNPRRVGGQRLVSDPTKYVQPVLQSPIFRNYSYSSSPEPTQYADAVQRAEFWGHLSDDWHTLLRPTVGKTRTMRVLQDPACGTTNPDGSAGHCNYHFSLNTDGSCCFYILLDIDAFSGGLFPTTVPVDASTPIGAAELNGDMTTKDVSTLLFPNTFLYFGDTSQCCVIGFHSFDYEPGDSSNGYLPRFYVMNYSSWVTPGIFGDSFADITPLSHELSETFNDPFVVFDGVTNLTPWWLSPNGNCQNDLEDGDVIEGLPNDTYPITMHGYTYHPQNEALLPWFEFQSPSSAIGGAYSYPDTSVLTSLSAPQNAYCLP